MQGLLLLVHHLVQLPAKPIGDVCWEVDGGVEAFKCRLDFFSVAVAGQAQVLLLANTEEVQITATSTIRPCKDHPRLDPLLVAGSAPQMPLQVVVVLALALAVAAPLVEDGLNLCEQLVADQRLVAPLDHLSLVGDVAEVIRIAQQLSQSGRRDRAAGVPALSGLQSSDCQLLREALQAELAGGVQLEGVDYQGSAFGVEFHDADVAAFAHIPGVAVAEPGPADGAPVLGLGSHLVGDVGAIPLDSVLVDGVEDHFDHVALWALRQVEGRLDDAYAPLAQLPLGDGGVDGVAEHPVELVDDDVVDLVAVRFDPGHHLLEDDPLLDLLGAAAGLGELVGDFGLKSRALHQAGITLGRDGDSFRVVVGLHLRR
ncbi:MAG TPA: hypothetical protein VMR18_00845 [Candidatus Saccharimonadales bacterium]|nr:hypothetical protein [Candidatus Saccharimonadales bacterium]